MRRAPVLALVLVLLPPVLVAQALAPTSADAEAASKRADIRKLLDAMHFGDMAVQGMQKMAATMKTTNTQVPAEFWDEFLKAATADKLIDVTVPVYEKNLTHAEVKAYLAFAATPEGASIMKKLPQVQTEAMEAGQAWGQQLGMEIAQKLHEQGKM